MASTKTDPTYGSLTICANIHRRKAERAATGLHSTNLLLSNFHALQFSGPIQHRDATKERLRFFADQQSIASEYERITPTGNQEKKISPSPRPQNHRLKRYVFVLANHFLYIIVSA